MQRVARQVALTGCAALIASGLVASPAAAEELSCSGPLGAITVDNLRVPQGASCALAGTSVKGTITVQAGATLAATGISVVGNVQAEGAASVAVAGSRIGGSVQVKQGGAARITDSHVDGDIQYDANASGLVAAGNRVGGSIQVVGNSGGAAIDRNTVDGNLQCKENRPAPTGSGNVVRGSTEDQCATMSPTPGSASAPTAPGAELPAPTVTVATKAVRRASRLYVDVDPNKGRGHWTFQVQKQRANGQWKALKSYRTQGAEERRTINLPKGTYRVVVAAKDGHLGATSSPVTLRR